MKNNCNLTPKHKVFIQNNQPLSQQVPYMYDYEDQTTIINSILFKREFYLKENIKAYLFFYLKILKTNFLVLIFFNILHIILIYLYQK